MKKQTQRHIAIDALRVLAILAVLAIHTTTRTLENSGFDSLTLAFFVNQVTRFAVPLFFLISGFVLEASYHNHNSTKDFILKRLKKIYIPYVFWSTIYYFIIYTKHTQSLPEALFFGNASYQLYFIPTLVLFYLAFPLLHRFYHLIVNKYVFITILIVQVLILIIKYYLIPLEQMYFWSVASLNYLVFILGIYFARNHERILNFSKKHSKVLLTIVIAFATLTFVEGKTLFESTHNYLYFYQSFRPGVLAYTVTLFALLYSPFSNLPQYEKYIKTASNLSFFVFFAHVILIEILGDNFLIIATSAYALAFLIHKIPTLQKITG